MQACKKSNIQNSRSYPYLYQKRGFYYYRFKLPKIFCTPTLQPEVRLSLRTSYMHQARKFVTELHSLTLSMLSTWMPEENLKDKISRLKKELHEKLETLLLSSPKNPISQTELQNRLDLYLKEKLEDDVRAEEAFSISAESPSGVKEKVNLAEIYDSRSRQLAEEIATADHFENWSLEDVFEMLDKGVLKPEEISKSNFLEIARLLHRYESIFYKIKSARLNGDFAYEKSFLPTNNVATPLTIDSLSQSPKKSLDLNTLIDWYCEIQIKDGVWKQHTLGDHKSRLENITFILGNKNLDDISREDMRSFRDVLEKLPPSRKKINKYEGMTWEEIIRTNPKKTLGVKTVNVIVQAISSMFEWAIREGVMSSNPAAKLSKKDLQAPIDKRGCFTGEEIQKIFYDGDYEKFKAKNPAYYWAPLIALYTGMRLEEVCQLHCADIYEDKEGIWVIDVREEDEEGNKVKKLKTINSKRIIPIHKELIKLGFKEYLEEVKQTSKRLFPQLSITEKTVKYGKEVGKTFSRYVQKRGIEKGKSFHSLRHTFSQFYKEKQLQNDIFRQVFGHEIPELAGRQYGARFSPKQCYDEIISKLVYL